MADAVEEIPFASNDIAEIFADDKKICIARQGGALCREPSCDDNRPERPAYLSAPIVQVLKDERKQSWPGQPDLNRVQISLGPASKPQAVPDRSPVCS